MHKAEKFCTTLGKVHKMGVVVLQVGYFSILIFSEQKKPKETPWFSGKIKR